MTFTETHVRGELMRPDDYLRGTRARSVPIPCIDENLRPALELVGDEQASRSILTWAFVRTLQCFNPCLSEESALFLAECSHIPELVAEDQPATASRLSERAVAYTPIPGSTPGESTNEKS